MNIWLDGFMAKWLNYDHLYARYTFLASWRSSHQILDAKSVDWKKQKQTWHKKDEHKKQAREESKKA